MIGGLTRRVIDRLAVRATGGYSGGTVDPGELPTPPCGFLLLVDDDGNYLVDDDGNYLIGKE